MKAILKWNLFALLVTQVIFAQDPNISINTSPSGSWVRIDSILVGKTPLTEIQIEPGEHQLHIAPPTSGVWNYEDRYIEIVIKENQDTTLNIHFDKPVFVNSIPYGAHLKSEQEHIGITPLYLPFESNRGNSFQIVKEGFEPYDFVLVEPEPILARLQRKEGYIEQEKKKPQLFGVLPKKHVESKFTLLAVTVATHWASFYFKNVADRKYDDYLHTADPQLMNKYWDQTQKYDRLSEISLGVSYVSLAGLIYLVIWH